MKRLKLLSAALTISCGVGVLMAVILTGNKNTLPRTAVVIPTQSPSIGRDSQPTKLPLQRTVQKVPAGVDPIVTTSISRKSQKKSSNNIGELIAAKNDVADPFPSTGKTIIVQSGDTLFAIARRAGLNLHKLASINSIEAPFVIRPGQILHLNAAE